MSPHARRCTPLALLAVLCSVLGALVVGSASAAASTPAPGPAVTSAGTSVSRPISDAPAAGSVPALPATTAGTPCAASAKACVDLSSQQAWLTDGAGHVTYGPVGALGGTRKHPTPTGTFTVDYKDAHHVSNLFTPGDMPNSVFFAPAVALHGGSLSTRSHGCVHLGSTASRKFFNNLSPGDTVQVVP